MADPDPPLTLSDLSLLRRQVAEVRAAAGRAGTFRGFRSATVLFSAAAAVVTAWADARPGPHLFVRGVPVGYDPSLWRAVAGVCLLVAGAEMGLRAHRGGHYGGAMLWTAAGQFLPCVAAGAAVTGAALRFNADLLPVLPGMWAVLFGLGVASCCRLLPRAFWVVAGWYVLAGAVGLSADPSVGPHAWFLGVTFGVGQGVSAGLLYLLVERPAAAAGVVDDWGGEELDELCDADRAGENDG